VFSFQRVTEIDGNKQNTKKQAGTEASRKKQQKTSRNLKKRAERNRDKQKQTETSRSSAIICASWLAGWLADFLEVRCGSIVNLNFSKPRIY
jgi:hypothetical protein